LDTTARYARVATGMIAGIESPLDLLERTDPSRSAVPIDPDQSFRLIPITHSGRSRSVCGEV
jgi:hypothetical protein